MSDFGKELPFTQDEYGWWGTPDEVKHPTKAGAVYYGLFDFCGCGDPQMVADLVVRLLTEGKRWDDQPDLVRPCGVEAATAIIKQNPEAAAWALLYMLDHWQLTEHGGSVNGAWLTLRGTQVAAILAADEVDAEAT